MSRFAKFLDKRFKTKEDDLGAPSIIIVEGVEKNVVMSLDRVRMKTAMVKFLIEKMALSNEMASKEADEYVEEKYKVYKEFILNL
jgi:hypothetical protein